MLLIPQQSGCTKFTAYAEERLHILYTLYSLKVTIHSAVKQLQSAWMRVCNKIFM